MTSIATDLKEEEKLAENVRSLDFRAGILAAALIAVVIAGGMGMGAGGGGSITCNSPVSQIQCGTQIVTISAGSSTGIQSVTFPTAFASIPSVINVQTLPTAQQLSFQFTFYDLITMFTPPTAVTWAGMPAAETEFLGLTVTRNNALFTNVNNIVIEANVQSAGAAGAILKAQFFNSTSSTWIDICGTGSDKPQVSISSIGEFVGPQCAPVSALTSVVGIGPVQIRIAGKNGDGVTSPSFGSISLRVAILMNVTPYATVFNKQAFGFTIVAQTGVIQNAAQNINVQWEAEI
jgi:hypothetical protein